MFLLVEVDKHWAGFGIEWFPHLKGVRLGWIGIHIFTVPFIDFVEMSNRKYHTEKLEELHAEATEQLRKMDEANQYPVAHVVQ